MKTVKALNSFIKHLDIDKNDISDGYHTFGELYDHRIALFVSLAKLVPWTPAYLPWRSQRHADGSAYTGWFIMGIGKEKGKQISYHLPLSEWDNTHFCETLDYAPEWDGHTPADVIKRLDELMSITEFRKLL